MRLRLAISIAIGAALVFGATALADPPAPISPGADAVLVADGTPIVFSASPPTPPTTGLPARVDFYISKDPTVDGNNSLTGSGYRLSGPPDGSGNYQGASDPDILGKPGTYFWQPLNPETANCSVPTPAECNGPVRRFVISPLPASAVTNASQVDTFLNKKPRHRTRHRKVKFTFSSNVDGAKFQCLFATGWEKCSSPHVFRHLKVGRYQFEVRAVVNGIEDTDPETWLFRVLRRHHH
jgi:hypothetical protein